MATKVKIGFVGVGSMGQCAHLKNYTTWKDECEVVALAECRPDMAKQVATRYGIPRVYSSHEEMLAKEKLDGIVSSQPFTRHGTLIPELAKYGKPIFTEKPLAGSIENGETIIAAEKQFGAVHMVGYHKRSDPATEYAKAEIERLKSTGELGKMTYVRIIMPAGDWVANGFTDFIKTDEQYPELQWDATAKDMDKETNDKYISFVNYYIHQVNMMRHLLGESYRATYADPSGVLMAGQSASGIACSLEMSPYTTSIDWQEEMLICFEKGWIRVELPAPLANNRPGKVTMHRELQGKMPETTTPDLPWVHAMRQQALNFIKFCRGEIPACCTAVEALEDLKVARDYVRLRFGV